MPAEWERHEATWLAWPTGKATWSGRILKEVEAIYLRMISELLRGEDVHLLVPNAATARRVERKLSRSKSHAGRLIIHAVKTVDVWIRDYGPIFVKRSSELGARSSEQTVAFTKWTFNAWGGKYKELARDNTVVDRLEYLERSRRINVPVVLEGGSIDVNGRGTCLTTEQCLLNPNRNPSLSKKEIEAILKKNLGIKNVIWLKEGIEGDDTDGHVDDIARFVGPRTILTAVEPDKKDANHARLALNLRLLQQTSDQDGKKFSVLELPMPGRVEIPFDAAQGRLPASYANFYIGNKAVLVPTYGHSNDTRALKIIASLFKGRKTVGIECTALVHGLGSIHCVTQQQPV